jgi:HD-GYP domain-containing protein (c-di-GMP phosphodiesterase class II)
MTVNGPRKDISIDQLTPGMFIVGVDVPWYRSPFLSHTRLIEDAETIQTMRQHGIRTVTIDISKGADVRTDTKEEPPAKIETDSRRAITAETPTCPTQPDTGSAHTLYRDAHETVERIFAHLEQGVAPSPSATKAVVSTVLMRIIDDRAAVMTNLALQKLKQFDGSLATHALDTCILSLVVAVEIGLDETAQTQLGTGALLHDAGYARLPRNLVRKRQTCTDNERLLLQQHPALGTALLTETAGFDTAVTRIVAEHHEREDGSGFPSGLKHDGISTLAMIVGIVDWYDGMVSRRGGRAAMLPSTAIQRLFVAGQRGQFKNTLTESVIRSLGIYPIGSLLLLNTGEQAVVVGINPGQRLKPLVKIIAGPRGESYVTPLLTDLAAQTPDRQSRSILRGLDPVQERVNIALYLDDITSEAA